MASHALADDEDEELLDYGDDEDGEDAALDQTAPMEADAPPGTGAPSSSNPGAPPARSVQGSDEAALRAVLAALDELRQRLDAQNACLDRLTNSRQRRQQRRSAVDASTAPHQRTGTAAAPAVGDDAVPSGASSGDDAPGTYRAITARPARADPRIVAELRHRPGVFSGPRSTPPDNGDGQEGWQLQRWQRKQQLRRRGAPPVQGGVRKTRYDRAPQRWFADHPGHGLAPAEREAVMRSGRCFACKQPHHRVTDIEPHAGGHRWVCPTRRGRPVPAEVVQAYESKLRRFDSRRQRNHNVNTRRRQ